MLSSMLSLTRSLDRRPARILAAIGLLAAGAAALPSLDWCPLPRATAFACEALAGSGPADASAEEPCGRSSCAGAAACPFERPDTDDSSASPLCDVEPGPIAAGDKLWCVRPPVTAITAKLVPLEAPAAHTPLAVFATPTLVAPPAEIAQAPIAHAPRPPTRRASHAPPQPRAPPVA
jgi:hypothetical protein